MNEPLIPTWFLQIIIFFLGVQTALLMSILLYLREWGSKANRKLHRIESYMRHTAHAIGQEAEVV